MRRVPILVLASAMLAAIPGTVWSQGFVTPYIGYNYGGDSVNCIGLRNCEEKHKNFGVSVGKTNGIFGLMRPHTLTGSKNALGYDIGAGLNIFFTSRLGVRGDIRRMRSMQDITLFIFSGEKLEFWRASLGGTIK